MSQSDTVQRILDAAEVLFAQKGFAETSLRAITSRAGVNLAAVNYHFGSKEALIQAVFDEQEAVARLLPDLLPLMASEDVQEGLQSFIQRRKAEFKGR